MLRHLGFDLGLDSTRYGPYNDMYGSVPGPAEDSILSMDITNEYATELMQKHGWDKGKS